MSHSAGPWEAHDDDGTGTLPCVLSEKVNPGGNFYVAQCNRFEDAQFIAAAPEMAEALQIVGTWLIAPDFSAVPEMRVLVLKSLRKAGLL